MGNYVVKYDDMDCSNLVKMMNLIEKQPQPIWDAIRKYYSKGFFMVQIEQEFGITNDFVSELKARSERRMKAYQVKTENHIKTMREQYEKQQNKLNIIIKELKTEISDQKQT